VKERSGDLIEAKSALTARDPARREEIRQKVASDLVVLIKAA
jgi:hypothetical protein